MDPLLASDMLRIAHLFAVVLAMGAAFYADWRMFNGVQKPVSARDLTAFDDLHHFVLGSMALVWVTGIALIWLRTGFVLADFSPKLFAKLLTVTLLSVNAVVIGKLALPLMRDQAGSVPLHFPIAQKLTLGAVAAMSTASWLLALSLGASKVLAVSGWDVLAPVLSGTYLSALTVAFAAALGSQMLVPPAISSVDPFCRLKRV
ncbi:MAG: hypothetical protein AAGE03_15860 [Pseudomonadota bacterium]